MTNSNEEARTLSKLTRWLAELSDTRLAVFQAIGAGVFTWLSALLGALVVSPDRARFWVFSITIVVSITCLVLLARLVQVARDRLVNKRTSDIALVYAQLDGLVMDDQTEVETAKAVHLVPANPFEAINRVTQALHNLLEARYQKAALPGEAIHFEAVVMTRSLVDGEITIASWANSDQRRPTSLSSRPQNPSIYERTVTGDLYRESATKRPEPRLISDTARAAGYQHLYPTQLQRIRSTVVYPILSSSNTLLATLVASADTPSVFRTEDEKYWYTLLGLYERRIGLELLRLIEMVKGGASAPF